MSSEKPFRLSLVSTMRRAVLAAAALCGLLPAAMAADTNLIFVSNERGNDIAVIDPAQDYRVVERIATSRRPRDMAFSSDHTLLYVSCGDDDVIDVIDVGTLAVVNSIPTGRSPEMIRLSRDDRLIYVSSEGSSRIEAIDIETQVVVTDIATWPEPEGIELNADGSEIYVASEVADMVHIIDAEAGVVLDNIVVGTRPRRFILPRPDELWVTDELSGTISIIDLTTRTVSETIGFDPAGTLAVDVTPVGIAMTSDARLAVVTLGRANRIAVVDIASRRTLSYVLVGGRAFGITLSSDDRVAYVVNSLTGDLSIVDLPNNTSYRSVMVGRVPHSVLVDD